MNFIRRWWLRRQLRKLAAARAALERSELWPQFKDQPAFKQVMFFGREVEREAQRMVDSTPA